MIGFINGRVDHIGTGFCLVEAQGVGYRIFMNASDLGRLAVDQRIKIYTYLSVREDALQNARGGKRQAEAGSQPDFCLLRVFDAPAFN